MMAAVETLRTSGSSTASSSSGTERARSRAGSGEEPHLTKQPSQGSRSSFDRLSTCLQDPRVLRATGVSALLSGFGRLFRDRKGLAESTFATEEALRLWSKSWQVERIDEFLSHCWSDAGLAKAIAVHVYYNSEVAVLVSLMVGSIFVVFRWVGWLPVFVLEDYHGEGIDMHYAPWSLYTGSLAFFVTLGFGHRIVDSSLVQRVIRRHTVFFDRLCVHQGDVELKEMGVLSFAAIVARSQRMVLLWSPTYFTRLWCTLECATLVRIATRDKSGKAHLPLVFYPTSIAANAFRTACALTFCCILYSSAKIPELPRFQSMNMLILAVAICTVSPMYLHTLRRYMRQRMLLSRQMEEFSVSNAGCVAEADRNMIYQTLQDWFGTPDAFNKVVHTTVREHVLRAIGSEVRVPFRVMSLGFMPMVCHQLDFIPIYCSLGGWWGVMMLLELPTYILWAIAQCQLLHQLARRLARERHPFVADVAVSASAAFVWVVLAFAQLALLGLSDFVPRESVLWFAARLLTTGWLVVLVPALHYAASRW